MQLILMRHGVAVERDEWKGDDDSRPLSPAGFDKTRDTARGLTSICPSPQLIASSPKARARQTAELVRDAWKSKPPLELWPELASDNFELWLEHLRDCKANPVLLVGHEPDLSRFTSFTLALDADAVGIEWKKAGVVALELDLETGRATLKWMLAPRQLRLLSSI